MRHRLLTAWIGIAAALAGCASPDSYMGIDLRTPAGGSAAADDSEMQRLVDRADETGCFVTNADAGATTLRTDTAACRALFSAILGQFAAGSARLSLPMLARRAQQGDKQAMLELGIRFEEGRGVQRDLEKAARLYAKAAASTGGSLPVYSPGVGKAPGRIIMINTGPMQPGLPEARRRMKALNGRTGSN